MDNQAPTRALNRRSLQLLQLGFPVLAVGVLLAIIGALLRTIRLVPRGDRLDGLYELVCVTLIILGFILLIVGSAVVIRAITRRRSNELAALTGDFLQRTGQFDEQFTFISNINRSGLGYIDAVLVGPPGALVFRILDAQGVFVNEASTWMLQKSGGQLRLWRTNPTKQVIEDIDHLRQYLIKHKLRDVPVYGIIVFTSGQQVTHITEAAPTVPVSHLETLPQNLYREYLKTPQRIPPPAVQAVKRLLLN